MNREQRFDYKVCGFKKNIQSWNEAQQWSGSNTNCQIDSNYTPVCEICFNKPDSNFSLFITALKFETVKFS